MEDFKLFVLDRLPDAAIDVKVFPGAGETWRAPNFGRDGGTSITITVPVQRYDDDLNRGALRRAGTQPVFVGGVKVQVLIPNDPSLVEGLRRGGTFFAFSWHQWRGLSETAAESIVDEVRERRRLAEAHNRSVAEDLRSHPANRRAEQQKSREAQTLERFPTEAVDAWIIHRMGYTAEELAALAKSTRRDRRREARRQMEAAGR